LFEGENIVVGKTDYGQSQLKSGPFSTSTFWEKAEPKSIHLLKKGGAQKPLLKKGYVQRRAQKPLLRKGYVQRRAQ
jgi:hypothetical protein